MNPSASADTNPHDTPLSLHHFPLKSLKHQYITIKTNIIKYPCQENTMKKCLLITMKNPQAKIPSRISTNQRLQWLMEIS